MASPLMMSRAQFLRTSLAGAGAVALLAACGGDDDDHDRPADGPTADGTATDAPAGDAGADGPIADGGTDAGTDAGADAGASCLANGTTTVIADNHGHLLVVTMADVQAGAEKSYDIRGGSVHTHAVTLTAAHFAQLAQNQSVQVTSTVTGHSHVVTIVCA